MNPQATAADPAPADGSPAAPPLDAEQLSAALALADDALVLSHRLAEWAGHAPVLEEEVALANIALDLLGHARLLLGLVGDEDELAFLREERDFRNTQLVEQPDSDFADTVIRQLYFSVAQELLYGALAGNPATPGPLREITAKAVKETTYHREHATLWTLRLGDGTEESHQRAQRAVRTLWRYTGDLFTPLPGLPVDWAETRREWRTRVGEVLSAATLDVPGPEQPDRAAWAAGGGRHGIHTESFGRMLAEMQHLHRSHPGATW